MEQKHDLLDAREAAKYIHKPEKTLANWRSARTGPAYFKIGGSVRYDRAELDRFIEAALVTPGGDVA